MSAGEVRPEGARAITKAIGGGRRRHDVAAAAMPLLLAFITVVLSPVAAIALPGETGQLAFIRNGDVWTASANGSGETRLTSGRDDSWPRWSPEGNRLAVVRHGDLVLLRANGSLLRVLTTHADVVGAPSWAPDGLRLVYARGTGGISVVEATPAGSDGTLLDVGQVTSVAWNPNSADQIAYTDGGAIFTVRPDGSDITEILPADPDGRFREELAWDPHFGHVVFMSTGDDGTRIEGGGVSLDGASGFDRSPAWSPNAQEMVFSRSGVLFVYRAEGFPNSGNVRTLGIDGETPDVQPALISSVAAYETSTGTALHFQIRPFGTAPVMVGYQTVAGAGSATEGNDYAGESGTVGVQPLSNPVTVLISILGDADPEPDETFFVDFTFPSDPAAPLRVRGTILNDDGGRNGVITYTGDNASLLGVFALDPLRGGSESIASPAWSAVFAPAGDRLSYLQLDAGGQLELVVADPSGTQVTFPVPSGAIDDELAWSPDGLRLAWTEGGALRVADPSSASSARQIATDALGASWSADAGPGPRRLVFRRWSTGAICTIREDGSGETCLTVAGDEPRWSPDNSTIAFLGAASVFLMDPSGSNVRAVAPAPAALVGNRRLRWSPRGGVLAFSTGDALFTVQEGTPAVPVAGLPPTIWGFDWSPDGQQLVVQASDPTSSFHLWIVGPDDLGQALARARRVTSLLTTAQEPRWSSAPARPTANLRSRGGIERFRQVRVEVELNAPSPETATFEWQTVNTGTATPDVDYTPVSLGTVVLQPGETRGAIVVDVVDDALEEGPEFFEVRLTSASAARLGPDTQVQVYITDDDGSPVAVNDVVQTPVNTPIDIAVLANDRDPDGEPLTVTTVGTPAHGTATFTGGIVTYTPQVGFGGIDHFLYSIANGTGRTATAAVSVHVGDEPLPPPPVLTVTPSFLDFGQVPVNKTKDLVLTVTNNTGALVALSENLFLEQGDPRPFDASSVDGDSCRWPWFRELDPGESCTQKVRFYAVPGADAASPARARLLDGVTFETLATIPLLASLGPPDTGPNAPPIPVDDLAGVAPGFTHSLYALVNDSDPDNDLLRIVAVSDPPHGTARVVLCNVFPISPNSDCIEYVPDTGYLGLDAITYTVADGRGGTASAVYHLTVGNVIPHIDAITPASGPTSGGQAVRITGSNFVYQSDVAFECGGSMLPLNVTLLTDNEILATTPPWPFPGLCDLQVRTRFAQVGRRANAYRYEAGPSSTTTTIATSGSPSRPGQPVTFTATVAATTGPMPQGSVRFDDTTAGAALGTVTLDVAGVARLETNALAVGTHAIVATYLPDAASPYQGSSGSLTQVVEPETADLSIAATAAPDPVVAGSVLTYTPTVTNHGPDTAHAVRVSLPIPPTVDFVGSSPVGWCTGPSAAAAGTIVCDLGDLPAGASNSILIETRPSVAGPLAATLTVSATETDPNLANNSAHVSVVVRLDPVVLEVVENIVVTDAPVVTPSVLLNVPETIIVTDTPTLTPSVMLGVAETIVVSDTPTLVVDTTPPTVTIDQAAGQPDPTSGSPIEFTVTFSEPVIGFDASDISFAGSTVGGSLTAQIERGPGASLTVFVSGMTGTGTVVASIPAGVAADANGNPNLASTSTDNSVLFALVSTTTTLTSSRNPSLTTAPPVFTATVTSAGSGAAPTGEVEFLQGGVVFGTSPLFERGGAMVAVIGRATLIVNESTHAITARYLGDGSHQPSESAPVLQAVHPGMYFMEDASRPSEHVRAGGAERQRADRGQPRHGRGRLRPRRGIPLPGYRLPLQRGLRHERGGHGGRSPRTESHQHDRVLRPRGGPDRHPVVALSGRRQRARANGDPPPRPHVVPVRRRRHRRAGSLRREWHQRRHHGRRRDRGHGRPAGRGRMAGRRAHHSRAIRRALRVGQ